MAAGREDGSLLDHSGAGCKVADVVTSEAENDQLVGWITGARPSMF